MAAMAEVGTVSRLRPRRFPFLPIVERGCCCTLEACCKIQGILAVVWSCLAIISGLRDMIFGTANPVSTLCPKCDPNEFVIVFASDDDDAKHRAVELVGLVIFMILDLMTLACALLFLKGIAERKPSLMDHYIRLLVVRIVVNAVLVFVAAVAVGAIFVLIFSLALISGIPYYMLVCAHSLQWKFTSPTQDMEMAPSNAPPPSYPPPPYGSGYAPPAPGYAPPAPGYAPPAPGYAPPAPGYAPPAPGYAPPAPGYAPPAPGYAPPAPGYAPPAPGYAPPGPVPLGFAPPQYVPQENAYPTKALDGSTPTMV